MYSIISLGLNYYLYLQTNVEDVFQLYMDSCREGHILTEAHDGSNGCTCVCNINNGNILICEQGLVSFKVCGSKSGIECELSIAFFQRFRAAFHDNPLLFPYSRKGFGQPRISAKRTSFLFIPVHLVTASVLFHPLLERMLVSIPMTVTIPITNVHA